MDSEEVVARVFNRVYTIHAKLSVWVYVPVETPAAVPGTKSQPTHKENTVWQKLSDELYGVITDSKFWALMTALIAATALLETHQIDGWQYLASVTTATGVYMVAHAHSTPQG